MKYDGCLYHLHSILGFTKVPPEEVKVKDYFPINTYFSTENIAEVYIKNSHSNLNKQFQG